jgi:hypothetical protein
MVLSSKDQRKDNGFTYMGRLQFNRVENKESDGNMAYKKNKVNISLC